MTLPHLVSPIDRAEEAEALLQAGADELYGGVVPPEWERRFGQIGSLNQRTFAQAQLGSFDALARVIGTLRRYGKPFSLTLNAPFYTGEQYPLLEKLVLEAAEIGISGVILADPGLLRVLRRSSPQLEYHVSTLAHAGNAETLRFFQALGATRAVIPRHLGTAAVSALVEAVPGMRLDVFILVGKCPNTEGLCTFHHVRDDRVWPCEIPYRIEPRDSLAGPLLLAARERQRSWAESDRRHGCGLCALPELLKGGIHGLKLVGRGGSTAMKVANLQLVKRFLDKAAGGLAPDVYREEARVAHRQRFGSPCAPNVCYYPEFCQGE